ncbi:MAG: LysR family transcriptional regulator [Gammaproteobacteria bacterium]|nr:LysR family transcriptional regulator [Gammaproteobacteria bacterium]
MNQRSNVSVSLDQWQALVAVVETGSYAAAAVALNKSQSAVTYLIQQLERRLGVRAFEARGRRAVLTPVGEMLHRQARMLLTQAYRLEQRARTASAGWEPVIRVAVEILLPPEPMLAALADFAVSSPATRIEVEESVLGGTLEALQQRRVDLAITPQIPVGFLGDAIASLRLVAVAHPDHALHRLNRALTAADLAEHRHLLVRDSGIHRDSRAISVEVDRRWTFSQFDTSIRAAIQGHGFAWYPQARIQDALAQGLLKPLPLSEGSVRQVTLYLVLADAELAGPGVRALASQFKNTLSKDITASSPLR